MPSCIPLQQKVFWDGLHSCSLARDSTDSKKKFLEGSCKSNISLRGNEGATLWYWLIQLYLMAFHILCLSPQLCLCFGKTWGSEPTEKHYMVNAWHWVCWRHFSNPLILGHITAHSFSLFFFQFCRNSLIVPSPWPYPHSFYYCLTSSHHMLTVCVCLQWKANHCCCSQASKKSNVEEERETSASLVLPRDLLLQQLEVKQWCQEDRAEQFKCASSCQSNSFLK